MRPTKDFSTIGSIRSRRRCARRCGALSKRWSDAGLEDPRFRWDARGLFDVGGGAPKWAEPKHSLVTNICFPECLG